MVNRDEAQRMLQAAEKDLAALRGMKDSEVFADEVFGFHAQQAVEKTLKAWLALLDVQYSKTHDLSLLLAQLRSHGKDVDDILDLVELNPYAVQFRYEAFEEMGEPLDREDIIEHVNNLMQRINEACCQ